MDLLKVLMDSAGGGSASQPGSQFGLDSLMKGLQTGTDQRYLDDPGPLQDSATVTDGNAILGHLLGSKDASRNVAAHAAQASGVDASVIKKMLPVVAAMAMGALSKQTDSGRRLQDDGGGLLGSLLDSNQDGQVLDDVINLAKKLF